ncbi:MarR family winged helix-turn-helix transcriptional regulator [Youngiibacter multivorans]|uniref:DNA-binding MarR family transcriptional regulator n=1 Tax=Youngiibacter multivorans TaxID=937251 RepID=A0ABS4G2I0_9CLOT|nr:MarR family transcriptional regulator [Youngiibacter multivorans]MBP1918749.1 DNA-binding MarR family transcriptional regulator [Youngiibacter multivorans]
MEREDIVDSILIWFKISDIHSENIREAGVIAKDFGLTLAQSDVIAQLGIREMTQNELAERLLITKGGISQLMQTMEYLGLIERRQDWKTKYVTLTDKGKEIHDRLVPELERFQGEYFNGLSIKEKKMMLEMLRKISGKKEKNNET